jgi:septal ring factor EnvC (AmiA/AmiB activator)
MTRIKDQLIDLERRRASLRVEIDATEHELDQRKDQLRRLDRAIAMKRRLCHA